MGRTPDVTSRHLVVGLRIQDSDSTVENDAQGKYGVEYSVTFESIHAGYSYDPAAGVA